MQFDHVAQQVPDIAAALAWWQAAIPGATVLYADDSWGLIEAGGAKLAFVVTGEHPPHVAFRVEAAQLERLAALHAAQISTHRDATRSFYLDAPGGQHVELIAYPDEG